jgi:hypothetical protein
VIAKGEPWGRPLGGPPDVEVEGADADLAAAVRGRHGVRVRFAPDDTSDLARAVGLSGAPTATIELPVDALLLDESELAVNMVVVGPPPDRLRAWHRARPCRVEADGRPIFDGPATTVVVANGQFLRGLDVVPRGHPGDRRCEVQVYCVPPGARRAMRGRLRTGSHVPHPGIRQFTARELTVRFPTAQPVEIDGRTAPARAAISVQVVPEALRLLA